MIMMMMKNKLVMFSENLDHRKFGPPNKAYYIVAMGVDILGSLRSGCVGEYYCAVSVKHSASTNIFCRTSSGSCKHLKFSQHKYVYL